MEFQDELKRLRANKGITQTKLGEAIHVSRSAVAKWEAGLGLPSEESVLALCVYFEVTREQLFPNRETEALLVEKNKKIRKNKGWLTVLSVILVVVTIVVGFFVGYFVIRGERERKRINRLLTLRPTVIDLYFNPRVGLITQEVAFENDSYIIPCGEWIPLYFEVVLDAQICEQWYELVPTILGFDTFYLKKIEEYASYGTNPDLRRQIYSVLVRTENMNLSSIALDSLSFAYVPDTERVEKYCALQTETLPIRVEWATP